jgi:hypothetical protein
MQALLNRTPKAAGTIKFNTSVSVYQLLGFILELKQADPEYQLHVRGAGDDGTHYIAFEHVLPDPSKETHDKVVDHFLQYFRVKLGVYPHKPSVPQGTKGWSISNVIASA